MIESNVCLLPMIDHSMNMLISMHKHYEKSVLPFTGGLLDQPKYYIDAMEFIGDVLNG